MARLPSRRGAGIEHATSRRRIEELRRPLSPRVLHRDPTLVEPRQPVHRQRPFKSQTVVAPGMGAHPHRQQLLPVGGSGSPAPIDTQGHRWRSIAGRDNGPPVFAVGLPQLREPPARVSVGPHVICVAGGHQTVPLAQGIAQDSVDQSPEASRRQLPGRRDSLVHSSMSLLRPILETMQGQQQQRPNIDDFERALQQAREEEIAAAVGPQGSIHQILDRRPHRHRNSGQKTIGEAAAGKDGSNHARSVQERRCQGIRERGSSHGGHYRTGHNGAMRTALITLTLLLLTQPVLAWNSAGHRLVAAMAWEQLAAGTRVQVTALLSQHPDHGRWLVRGRSASPLATFVEAATWPDDIRQDKRFTDGAGDAQPQPADGFVDVARHGDWHYVDLEADGIRRRGPGQLDRQLERLIDLLGRAETPTVEKAYALPWLIHLVGDIHQPLHVGCRDDEGGNRFAIEDPFNRRLPISNLHTWWDDLPGTPWLRGARLSQVGAALLATIPPPPQGDVALWRGESWDLACSVAYPTATGSLLPLITAEFRATARETANRRLVAAAHRLSQVIEAIFPAVPRETPALPRP